MSRPFNKEDLPMRIKIIAIAVTATTLLTGCQVPSTPTIANDPRIDGAAKGAIGGAVIGQVLGGDTEATATGAVLGGLAGGYLGSQRQQASGYQSHPCADIYERFADPEVAGDLCDRRLSTMR